MDMTPPWVRGGWDDFPEMESPIVVQMTDPSRGSPFLIAHPIVCRSRLATAVMEDLEVPGAPIMATHQETGA